MKADRSENSPPVLYFLAFVGVWTFAGIVVLKTAGVSIWVASALAGGSAPLVATALWRGYVRYRSRQSL